MKKRALSIFMTAVMAAALTACAASTEQTSVESTENQQAVEEIGETETATSDTPDYSNVFSNKYFEITIPDNVASLSEVEVEDDLINIYDKESKDAGFGALILTLWAVPVPREYAGGPYEKIGELTTNDGQLCDMVVGHATEIQWDYNVEEMPENFQKLDNSVNDIIASITGINGYEYAEGAGTKGDDLYDEVLARYVTAVNEDWDADKYESEGMSPQFVEVLANASGDKLSAIGYYYADLNLDGIDELMVGEFGEDDWKGVIYDVYTMVDGTPAHVVSGTARDRYFSLENDFLVNEWSGGADSSGADVYALMANDTELVYQFGYKYDGYEDEENPWFRSYDGQEYEKIDEVTYDSESALSNRYERFDYTPLSENEDALNLAK